jgi:hypothetical protein
MLDGRRGCKLVRIWIRRTDRSFAVFQELAESVVLSVASTSVAKAAVDIGSCGPAQAEPFQHKARFTLFPDLQVLKGSISTGEDARRITDELTEHRITVYGSGVSKTASNQVFDFRRVAT